MTPPETLDVHALLEHRDVVRSIARALLGDEHRADDVFQETCVRALERPPRAGAALAGWLTRVARNLAINHRRREGLRPEREEVAARPEAVRDAEERDLELEEQMLAAVRELEPPYRTVLYLRYWRDLGPSAIARELGVPVATVKTRLQRGIERLRRDLDRRYGGERGPWSHALGALALTRLAARPAEGTTLGILLMNKSLAAAVAEWELGPADLVFLSATSFLETGLR